MYRTALTSFRTSTHDLLIETGRYVDIDRNNRVCKSCNQNTVESEYHFLLVCTKHKELRRKYLPPYYNSWPNLNKFTSIMTTTSKRILINLSKYLYYANENRITS